MWNVLLWLIFCILPLQIYLLCVQAQDVRNPIKRAKHGEHCNKTTRCDTLSYLTCNPTTSLCECQRADTMFYDPAIKSCLVLVGEKCKFQLVKSKEDTFEEQHNVRNTLEDELDCVQNAFCNRSGFCSCSGGYVELSNGTCIAKRNFGESCSVDGECRQDQFLQCINGHCSCNETVATYNILIRQCVGKAGKPCIGSSSGCVYNAECVDSSASYLAFTRRRMRQSVQLCGCSPGFVTDESGYCLVGLGGQCSKSKTCAREFHCRDGICRCPYENLQLALFRSQTCVSLVGGPCNETIQQITPSNSNITSAVNYRQQIFSCTDNAYCAMANNGSFYECQCNTEGFVENDEGTCDLGYGATCNSIPNISANTDSSSKEADDQPSWIPGPKCGNTMYCINGVCQCESLLYDYYKDYGMCLGKVGARCELGKTSIGCIPGAVCVPSNEVRSPYGKCNCTSAFVVTNNRTCLKF